MNCLRFIFRPLHQLLLFLLLLQPFTDHFELCITSAGRAWRNVDVSVGVLYTRIAWIENHANNIHKNIRHVGWELLFYSLARHFVIQGWICSREKYFYIYFCGNSVLFRWSGLIFSAYLWIFTTITDVWEGMDTKCSKSCCILERKGMWYCLFCVKHPHEDKLEVIISSHPFRFPTLLLSQIFRFPRSHSVCKWYESFRNIIIIAIIFITLWMVLYCEISVPITVHVLVWDDLLGICPC